MTFALAFITQDQNSVFMSASLIQQLQYEWQVEMIKKLHVRKNDPYESSKKTTKKTLHFHFTQSHTATVFYEFEGGHYKEDKMPQMLRISRALIKVRRNFHNENICDGK